MPTLTEDPRSIDWCDACTHRLHAAGECESTIDDLACECDGE